MAKATCGDCDFVGKSMRGLALHRRAKHPPDEAGENVKAVEATLAELARMGRLEDVDAAEVQALRSMAQALDENPFNSQMWKVYGEALERLTADDGDDDAVDALLERLSAEARHTPKG